MCPLFSSVRPQGYVLQEAKAAAVAKYQKHDKDVGSSAVQIAQLTETVSQREREGRVEFGS